MTSRLLEFQPTATLRLLDRERKDALKKVEALEQQLRDATESAQVAARAYYREWDSFINQHVAS